MCKFWVQGLIFFEVVQLFRRHWIQISTKDESLPRRHVTREQTRHGVQVVYVEHHPKLNTSSKCWQDKSRNLPLQKQIVPSHPCTREAWLTRKQGFLHNHSSHHCKELRQEETHRALPRANVQLALLQLDGSQDQAPKWHMHKKISCKKDQAPCRNRWRQGISYDVGRCRPEKGSLAKGEAMNRCLQCQPGTALRKRSAYHRHH